MQHSIFGHKYRFNEDKKFIDANELIVIANIQPTEVEVDNSAEKIESLVKELASVKELS